MSTQQNSKIGEMGRMGDGGWRWELNWRMEFFEWEELISHELLVVIDGFQPVDGQDSWRWCLDPEAGFTVG
jgi:hypothetical protein